VAGAELRVAGAVLCGGASRRMGADKALIEIDGVALAQRVHDALVAAACTPVFAIGGDARALRELGLHVVPDLHPGEGPLGALITALVALHDEADIVVALACDLPDADPRGIASIVAPFREASGGSIDAVVPRSATRRHMHHAAWRTATLPVLRAAFAAGERAPRRVLDQLRVHEPLVGPGLESRWLADLDRPDDLARRRAGTWPAPAHGRD
jgi:molybdenum cofactor guanylyltransferase